MKRLKIKDDRPKRQPSEASLHAAAKRAWRAGALRKQKDGKVWALHFHHSILAEAIDPEVAYGNRGVRPTVRQAALNRLVEIRNSKDPSERAVRLARFRPIRGKVPQRVLDGATLTDKDMQALHAKECKRCPWNGRTLFPVPQ